MNLILGITKRRILILFKYQCFTMRIDIKRSIRKVYIESWNNNTRNNISFSVSAVSFIHLMDSIDFTNNQNAIRRVIWDYIYTLKIKKNIKDNTWSIIICTNTQDAIAKVGGLRLAFIRKKIYSLVNDENDYNM